MSESGRQADERSTILWDVVSEHFDEAAFAFRRWNRALDSPSISFEGLTERFEERLMAHVDGLAVGGTLVAEHLLEPALATLATGVPSPGEGTHRPPLTLERAVPAAMALLHQGIVEPVKRSLFSSQAPVALAAERALSWIGAPGLEPWIAAELASEPAPSRLRVLLRLAVARDVPIPNLPAALLSSDPEQTRTAILATRAEGPRRQPGDVGIVETLILHPDAGVREAALVTALCFGSVYAFERCLELAAAESPASPMAMILIGLLGAPRHHQVLVRQLDRPANRNAAIRALGLSGHASSVATIVPYLKSNEARVARLAADAVSTLTGLDTTAGPYRAPSPPEPDPLPPLEQDLASDLMPDVDDELPLPNAAAVDAAWRAQTANWNGRPRTLLGRPWSLASVTEALARAPMRLRHPLALWLLVRSGASVRIDTRALPRVQRAQARALQGLTEQALRPSFADAA